MSTLPVLYLLSGLPCSGKSTFAKSLEADGASRVNVDDMMIAAHGRLGDDYPSSRHIELLGPILARATERVEAYLASGSDVVFDHGLGHRAERDSWKQVAVQAGAQWDLIRFDADLATLRARCILRSSSPDSVPITDEVLYALAADWELPVDEGQRCIDSTIDWVQDFYTVTNEWWGGAESSVDVVDMARAETLATLVDSPHDQSVLELGCGYGTTAAATANIGFAVTGIDFSDRVDRAPADKASFVKANFLTHDFDRRFDVVTYWDGFGVGHDTQQLELLDRIANDLVEPGGVVVIEVFDPTGWQRDDGLLEHRPANPRRGYHHALTQARTFDPASNRAVDAWKLADDDRIWSQSLRCYSLDEFAELVDRSMLVFDSVIDFGRSDWSYVAVLRTQ